MSEVEFADILGISYPNYKSMKYRGSRTKVLTSNKKEISREEKEKIIKEILESNKVIHGKSIKYGEFLILYEAYKDKMSEVEFADILGIKYSNYKNMKYRENRAKVLKSNKKEITEEEKEEIIEKILKSNKVIPGKLIKYGEFLMLYEAHKDRMSEVEFADILGIRYYNYQNMKKRKKQNKSINKQ